MTSGRAVENNVCDSEDNYDAALCWTVTCTLLLAATAGDASDTAFVQAVEICINDNEAGNADAEKYLPNMCNSAVSLASSLLLASSAAFAALFFARI